MNFDIKQLMKKAKEMQSGFQEAKDKLKDITVDGESGGGMVKVTASCDGRVKNIEVAEECLTDKDMMQDLIVGAVNNALDKAQEKSAEEMKKLTGGLPDIPGFNI